MFQYLVSISKQNVGYTFHLSSEHLIISKMDFRANADLQVIIGMYDINKYIYIYRSPGQMSLKVTN